MIKAEIKAEIIADSLNPQGKRLTTFVLEFLRIVLAEFNTHRAISRNSASSRAIPFEKMLKRVETDPFIPIKWMKDHKGMQGNEYFEGKEVELLKEEWINSSKRAIFEAKQLSERGLTKQIVNRLLEPYLYHTVIATGTDWENFFALRAHEAAEIHIQDLAYKMLEIYNFNSPKKLKEREFHIPFGDTFDYQRLYNIVSDNGKIDFFQEPKEEIETLKVKIATVRCARVSYMNFEGKDDYEADLKLHDNLLSSGHMSPFEHCAQSLSSNQYYGNFCGFQQYRKTIQGENKLDNRVKQILNERVI